MLYYAMVFLVIALIAGVLGFGGIAGVSVEIAKDTVVTVRREMIAQVIDKTEPAGTDKAEESANDNENSGGGLKKLFGGKKD